MSSDFERLVGSSNPAYQAQAQAQQRAGGYPPQPPRRSLDNANPFLIDDDEDYDDTPTTDSRFRQPPSAAAGLGMGMGPTSTYPYAASYGQRDLLGDDPPEPSQRLGRAASTGSKKSAHSYGTGQPQGWTFDQDDPLSTANGSSATVHGPAGGGGGGGLPFAGSKAFNGVASTSTDELRAPGKGGGGGGLGGIWKQLGQGKFPWQKERVLTGERIIFLNDSRGNGEQRFVSNYVSTTKYNLATFLPKFLIGEFHVAGCASWVADVNRCTEKFSNYANLFFLFTGMSSGFDEEMNAEFFFASLHPANPWSITHEPIHDYCAPWYCATGISNQGDARRLGTTARPDLRSRPR